MRKNFLKIVPTILELVRKIVVCGSSHRFWRIQSFSKGAINQMEKIVGF
ncbi:hypothetical protein [Leptospira kirschneri]|nr:hypothetical protein [Leptospira kirschneri]